MAFPKSTKKKRPYRKSKSSTVVPVRLPNEIVAKIDRLIEQHPKYRTRGGLLKGRIIYDFTRKHIKHKED